MTHITTSTSSSSIDSGQQSWAFAPGVTTAVEQAAAAVAATALEEAGAIAETGFSTLGFLTASSAAVAAQFLFPAKAGKDGFDDDANAPSVEPATPTKTTNALSAGASALGAKAVPATDCAGVATAPQTPQGIEPTDATPYNVPLSAMKKAIPNGVRFATEREVIKTLEGPVTAEAGDAIMTGPGEGNTWPIKRETFDATYDYDPCTGEAAKKPIVVQAVRMTTPFEVKVGWSDEPIQGKPGDYKVSSGGGDSWVVADHIFRGSYLILEGAKPVAR